MGQRIRLGGRVTVDSDDVGLTYFHAQGDRIDHTTEYSRPVLTINLKKKTEDGTSTITLFDKEAIATHEYLCGSAIDPMQFQVSDDAPIN